MNTSEGTDRETILEQYKALIGDVGNVGTRYATANGFYLAVITGLIGLLAFAGADKSPTALSAFAVALVSLFGWIICWIWRETIRFYGKLFSSKFFVLRLLEASLPVKVYELEGKKLYGKEIPGDREAGGLAATPLTENEQLVPSALMWFFGIVGIVALIGCGYLLVQRDHFFV